MAIPSPQFAREQDNQPSIDTVEMQEDAAAPTLPAQGELDHEEIALLARKIYQDEGRPEGRAAEHWHEAERRLRE